ncbi:hypothetical protein OROHE_006783 [Orobanche hederae]
MGGVGCTAGGTLDDSKFDEPMPWIGMYVVAASAVCAIGMALDAIHGFRCRKLWFPSKFFALNATTLTLIGVAVKLSVDLNTSMPRLHDQLAKLSSTTFICTAIGNSMPSLGTMENKELMMNVVALGILVITIIVNVCIQLGTGVIYVFWIEQVVIMLLMVVLFAIFVSSSLAIPTTKYYFDLKYNKKYELAMKECDRNCSASSVSRRLRDDLMRYWMMAHTCNPQFVVGRLATCTASGAFCLISAVTLVEAMLRSYFMPWCFTFCKGESDYKWSAMLILVTQAAAVTIGTIAPASRWFLAIKFRCPKRTNKSCQTGFSSSSSSSVENYWVQMLNYLKECPLDVRIRSRHGRKLVHNAKNKALDLCILIQKAIIVSCKFVRLISILFVSRLITIHRCCIKLVKCKNSIPKSDTESGDGMLDLSQYVLHLEGEEELIDVMMECDRDATGYWVRMGRKKEPKYLIQLIEKLRPSRGFEGVYIFDSDQIPSLDSSVEPPNSWALPVVTLTSIAVATSNSNFHSIKELIKCVNEGLKYIRIIENSLDIKRDVTSVRKAAEIVWVGVDLHYRWLDVDLREMAALQEKSPKDIISELSDMAKHKFMDLRKKDVVACSRYGPAKWPIKVLAANAMYRICQTLLLPTENKSSDCTGVMFDRLTAMITDIIGACLTNLQHAISIKCHRSSIEQREESVRHAILLLGKTEKILEILSCQPLPSSDPDEMACINSWRAMSREKDQLCFNSAPTNSVVTTSSDL